jgi:hypothetical protein
MSNTLGSIFASKNGRLLFDVPAPRYVEMQIGITAQSKLDTRSHRSHFGSRYTLGCCCQASLLSPVRVPAMSWCSALLLQQMSLQFDFEHFSHACAFKDFPWLVFISYDASVLVLRV